MILEPLRALLRTRKGRVRLQLVGAVGDQELLRVFDGLPVDVLNTGRPVDYPAFVAWMVDSLRWDLAIAPLEDSPFTRCKSDLKLLDYAALGVPGIYSRVAPYATTVRHGETGWLAESAPDGWREALERLVDDADLRSTVAANARRYVAAERTLARTAARWPDAIFTLAA